MRIVISGTNTQNKGAELMLYAILQQIEEKHPEAEVFLHQGTVPEGLKYIKTTLKLREMPHMERTRLAGKFHLHKVLCRLGLKGLFEEKPIKDIDYFFDASGFCFSDQWAKSFTPIYVKRWKERLERYHKDGAKVVFLPQAFGPVNEPVVKDLLRLVSDNSDLIIPRESISEEYLYEAGVDKNKVKSYTDFTSLIHGKTPERYKYLENAVCFIPNMRMIDKGIISLEDYINLFALIASKAKENGHSIYILNHESKGDERCAYMIQEKLGNEIEVVTGLTAIEVKGLISTAYLCVTSRFHGVASALNSCVPCLATSWSHKYEKLFNDYDMTDCVLDISNIESCISRIEALLNRSENDSIRARLLEVKPRIVNQTEEMWNLVWNL